jgi:hypothetical protein
MLLPPTSAWAFTAGATTDWMKRSLSVPTELVAVTVNEKSPVAVGVPVYAPVAGSSDMPGGKAPALTLHVTGVDPLAVNAIASAAAPAMPGPSGEAGAVMDGVCRMVCENARVALPRRLVAVTVKLKTPAACGVPAYWPVVASSAMPGGSAPAVTANVIGAVPVAMIEVGANAAPTTPFPIDAGAVIDGTTVSFASSWQAPSVSETATIAAAQRRLRVSIANPFCP